jgi:TrmH family RNA methyltransferase
MIKLTSPQNARVKSVVALQKAKERKARGVFAVEGAREIDRALRSGYELVEMFVCPEILSAAARTVAQANGGERFEVTPAVFEKMAVREGSDGLVAVLRQKAHTLDALVLPRAPLLVVVEGVEKPGNLGALPRSADGAGVDAVVVLDDAVDIYNPNVVRSSLGTVFHVPTAVARGEDLRAFCRERGIKVHAAALDARAVTYTEADYRGGAAILLGSEKAGLSPYWLAEADRLVQIPMLGLADSLNVATAGAILAYEARRQRGVPS